MRHANASKIKQSMTSNHELSTFRRLGEGVRIWEQAAKQLLNANGRQCYVPTH